MLTRVSQNGFAKLKGVVGVPENRSGKGLRIRWRNDKRTINCEVWKRSHVRNQRREASGNREGADPALATHEIGQDDQRRFE